MSNVSINNSKVDLFYKLVDKACMVYYNEWGIDYLEAFIKVSESLTRDFDEIKLSKKAIDKLNAIYEEISNTEFLNEEVRLACELVFVKGLKHRNVLLDFMTPDVINYLYVHIIKSILDNVEGFDKSEITILDTVLGTSNLLQTIINNVENYKDINILGVGIEKDELLVHLSQAFSELLGNEIVINLSKNSYILSPLRVTLQPIGWLALNLKAAIDFLDFVTNGFCPVIAVKSFTASSSNLELAVASPTPILITIFSICGTCITLV